MGLLGASAGDKCDRLALNVKQPAERLRNPAGTCDSNGGNRKIGVIRQISV
jgi:hypothetical protein